MFCFLLRRKRNRKLRQILISLETQNQKMKKILFTLLFIVSASMFSQENVQVDLSNPNATIYTHIYFLMPDSYEPAKAAQTIHGLPKKEAISVAIKIKEIFDGRGKLIDFDKISKDPKYVDTIFTFQNNLKQHMSRFVPFPVELPEIYVEKVNNRWYYSKETLEKLDEVYEATFPWEFTWIQKQFPDSAGLRMIEFLSKRLQRI